MEFERQYHMIQSARRALLDYCDSLTTEDFLTENSTFGRGSIRNLLVHNAYTYQYWLGVQALGKDLPFPGYESVTGNAAARLLFEKTDAVVGEFIARFQSDAFHPLRATLREHTFDTTPLELFTHAISHEFHHKGQILSLSRHLGYTPVDTDVIR